MSRLFKGISLLYFAVRCLIMTSQIEVCKNSYIYPTLQMWLMAFNHEFRLVISRLIGNCSEFYPMGSCSKILGFLFWIHGWRRQMCHFVCHCFSDRSSNPVHNIKACGRVQVLLRSILTMVFDGSDKSGSRCGRRTPRYPWIGGWITRWSEQSPAPTRYRTQIPQSFSL